jgi:beta-barrel assembly-enhancing protease
VLTIRFRKKIAGLLCLGLLMTTAVVPANEIKLPLLGDSASGIVSPQQEYDLGRAWLQIFRSRVATLNDPLLKTYMEQLLFKLATRSELTDRRLELIIINNPTMNAFAVPGGVIGAHTGLFQYAQTEQQLASVFAHELGHLSQRHFARRVANQRANAITSMAGMLAGLVLMATVGGDAGMAAMTASQAAVMDNTLRYSRQNEQEADHIGIATMYRAGMDPSAVAEMFDRMLAATRYTGHQPPEFLLTHPLTESRIADARNRLGKYPKQSYNENPEYHLMRARALMAMDNNPQRSLRRFQSELDGHTKSETGARYGMVLALSALGQQNDALEMIAGLLTEEPENFTLQLTAIALVRANKNYQKALDQIADLTPRYPNSYPLQMELAETLLAANRYGESEKVLEQLVRSRPTDPDVWFQLAETSGLAGDISGVHIARAEYFILTGVYDQARQQLGYALRLVERDFKQSSIIQQRLRDLDTMEAKAKKI